MALPSWTFVRAIFFRSLIVWVAIRAVLVADSGDLQISVHAALLLIIAATALATLEGRRRNEHIFLANLRVPIFLLVLLAALLPALLEILIAIGGAV